MFGKAHLLLSISDDVAETIRLSYPEIDPGRIVKIRYSVGSQFGLGQTPNRDGRLVTYMPRKLADHAGRVASILPRHLPDRWQLQSIDGMSERECVDTLSRSSIFMSFSNFEGLPLPPLKAALAGTLVVGDTGQDAKDYWDPVLFSAVEQGDVRLFVQTVAAIAAAIERGVVPAPDHQKARAALAARYSAQAERASLSAFLTRIDAACRPSIDTRELGLTA